VEKSAAEQCSPAKNSFPFTGRASIARAACAPSEPYEYAPSDQGSRAQADWLISVEDSLGRNQGTLAVQSMDRLLGEHGTLAALKSKGYHVEGP